MHYDRGYSPHWGLVCLVTLLSVGYGVLGGWQHAEPLFLSGEKEKGIGYLILGCSLGMLFGVGILMGPYMSSGDKAPDWFGIYGIALIGSWVGGLMTGGCGGLISSTLWGTLAILAGSAPTYLLSSFMRVIKGRGSYDDIENARFVYGCFIFAIIIVAIAIIVGLVSYFKGR